MKASDLVASWTTRDNKRLTSKQFSIRLPVHIAARISALCDMFPGKTRTDIMADLLDSALEELEKSFGHHYSEEGSEEVDGMIFYPDIGRYGDYARLANKYFKELEKELGNENSPFLLSTAIGKPAKPKNEEDDF